VGNPVAAIGAGDGLTPDSVAYLCGPPGMIEAARKHLEELGLAPENIFAEQFVASN
jgi:benzoate/toluate 1,2-dioxygenase reductase subunit